jgi:hypothetical protein
VVVPARVGGLGPAAQVGLVHHVVVVEGREVGELDDAGRHQQPLVVLRRQGLLGRLGREQHQQRAHPLAAGVQQVPCRVGDEGRVTYGVAQQLLLDLAHPGVQPLGQALVEDRESQGLDHGVLT